MEEQEKTCETCKHFYRHYVHWSGKRFSALDVGHCGDPRARYKSVNTPACFRYVQRKESAS